jgi:glyoxylase-like metal-dependent hydrolase (beta-lactamase superfamily II)
MTTGLALLAPPPTGTAPTMTFNHTLMVSFAGEEVRLCHRPGAHTDGDVTVQFVHAGVVAVGDLIFPDRFPFIDMNAGGTLASYLATLAALAGEFPEGTQFVATHGAIYSAGRVQDDTPAEEGTRGACPTETSAGAPGAGRREQLTHGAGYLAKRGGCHEEIFVAAHRIRRCRAGARPGDEGCSGGRHG